MPNPPLPLTPDELLTTTRAVRRRLDLTRPVERDVIEACLRIAQQAPSDANRQHWHFVIVTDPARRAALAELYRRGGQLYRSSPAATSLVYADPDRQATRARVVASADYLLAHLHEVPVHVIPCIEGRTEGQPVVTQAERWGSILQATWSFQLAARARGLGTCWTTFHLAFEAEAAQLLGIPFAEIMQAGLTPLAYTKGTRFKPAPRAPLETMVHWDRW